MDVQRHDNLSLLHLTSALKPDSLSIVGFELVVKSNWII